MITPKPRETIDLNEAYDFYTQDKGDRHTTTIIIDGLNDFLLMMPWHMPEVGEVSQCTCNDFKYRKRVCKHMKEVLDYLKSIKVEYREDEPKAKE